MQFQIILLCILLAFQIIEMFAKYEILQLLGLLNEKLNTNEKF